jgi:hypothetical protein
MSCKRFQRYLHLYRPGEMSDRERQELETHLETCTRCGEEWRRIQAAESRIARMREEVLVPSDPPGLTERIMAGIEARPRRQVRPFMDSVAEVLDRLFGPALPRRAAAVVCLGLLCSFLVQHALMLREVGGLERKMARAPYSTANMSLNYVIPLEKWEQLEDELGNGLLREALGRFMQRKGDKVYLAKRPVRRLLVRYRDRPAQRALVLKKILEKNPDLKAKIKPFFTRKAPGTRPWFKLERHRRKQP